jgi:hypothetical protein
MTSSEIIDRLFKIKDKDTLNDLKDFFGTADLVKFAKYNPQMNENDINLTVAIEFINQTRQSDEELIPQPTEMIISEQRSLRSKAWLIGCIVILSTAIMGAYVYIGIRLYDLFLSF